MLEVLQSQASFSTWLMRFVLHMQERNPTGISCGVSDAWIGGTPVFNRESESWRGGHEFSDLLLVVDLVQYRPHRSLLSLLSMPELHSFLLPAREP